MFKFHPSKEWLENSLKLEADYDISAGGMKMSENANQSESTNYQKNDRKAEKSRKRREARGPVMKETGDVAVIDTAKIKGFKQVETTTFKDYGEADTHRKGIPAAEGEKVRVKYRRERKEYDVVLFRLEK